METKALCLSFPKHQLLLPPRANTEAMFADVAATLILGGGFSPVPSSSLLTHRNKSPLCSSSELMAVHPPPLQTLGIKQNANNFRNSSCLAWQDGYCSYIANGCITQKCFEQKQTVLLRPATATATSALQLETHQDGLFSHLRRLPRLWGGRKPAATSQPHSKPIPPSQSSCSGHV